MGGLRRERIGIFGGTFDPPHIGHTVAAVSTRFALELDVVLMIPASIPWQKADLRAISPAEDRLAMVYAAVDGIDGLAVSPIEIERGGDSYSVDTLESLAAAPNQSGVPPDLFLLVGSDVAPQLDTWKNPGRLRELCTLVVYDRQSAQGGEPPAGWSSTRVDVPLMEVSSTDIRARVRDGRPIDGLVAPAVARHIANRGLYGAADSEGVAVTK